MSKRIVSWTINVQYDDGTEENISDVPNQVAATIDEFLTEIESGNSQTVRDVDGQCLGDTFGCSQ